MELLALSLSAFGVIGFILAVGAYHKADKLEKELKRRDLIGKDFNGDG